MTLLTPVGSIISAGSSRRAVPVRARGCRPNGRFHRHDDHDPSGPVLGSDTANSAHFDLVAVVACYLGGPCKLWSDKAPCTSFTILPLASVTRSL